MDPLRPGYRRRETRKQDQTQLVIATIIAAPVVLILFLFALSRLDPDLRPGHPGPASTSTLIPPPTPVPVVSRPSQQEPSSFSRSRQVEFYSHPAPSPTLTPQQRYERASEIYRSMGSESPSAPRPAAPRQSQSQPDYSGECARLAKEKARIESHMRAGYNASSSGYYHGLLNRIVQRMQRYHCLR